MFSRHRGFRAYHAIKPTKKSRSFWSFLTSNKRPRTRERVFFQKKPRNPYFLKHQFIARTKAPRLKIAIGFLALLGVLGVLIFHPYFLITRIEMSPLEKIPDSELRDAINGVLNQKRWWFFSGHNVFLANTGKMNSLINDKYALEKLKIKTRLPNILQIALKEKQAHLIVHSQMLQLNGEPKNYYFLLDAGGKIIQEIKTEELNNPAYFNLPRLKRENPKEIKINDQLASVAAIEFLNFLQREIPERTKINIAYSQFVDEMEEGRAVRLTTTEGWDILVDRLNDWEKQLQVLTVFLRDRIKENRSRLHYIDVRYENRSYYQ